MNLYTDFEQIDCGRSNTYLADILRPFVRPSGEAEGESTNYTGLQGLHDPFEVSEPAHEVVDAAAEADLHILPFQWNYYVKTKSERTAHEFLDRARTEGKPVAVWIGNDHGVRFPQRNEYIFRYAAYRSRRRVREFVQPYFIHDPLVEIEAEAPPVREKGDPPVIGFCGDAGINTGRLIRESTRTAIRNLKSITRLVPDEPNAIVPGAYTRHKALEFCESSTKLRCNFIRRERRFLSPDQHGYEPENEQTKLEMRRAFLDNIMGSDYVLCVRGLGNFSIRLYETLALGRIPVVIDTDFVFPVDHVVEWGKHCVIVPRKQLDFIGDHVARFHDALSSARFRELQVANRELWASQLSFEGFCRNFHLHFPAESAQPAQRVWK